MVFIMTTSGADKGKVNAYNLRVAGFVLKTNRPMHSWKRRRPWTSIGVSSNSRRADIVCTLSRRLRFTFL
jgi:hypothetical protein